MTTSETYQLSITSSLYSTIPDKSEGQEELVLPAQGESRHNCGVVKWKIECPTGDRETDLVYHDCSRIECPICSDNWRKKAANRIADKTMNTVGLFNHYYDTREFLSSVIISAPVDLWDLSYDEIQKTFRKVVGHLGATGVAAIFHAWRFRNIETHDEAKWIQFRDNPETYESYWSPHWHCIVMGRVTPTKEFHEVTNGWNYYKQKNERTGKYRLAHKDVFRVTHYALSHIAFRRHEQRHYTRYYGEFRKSKIVVTNREYKAVHCEKCKEQLIRTYVKDNYASGTCVDGLQEPHYEIITTRVWALRVDGELLDYQGNKYDL